MPFTNVVTHYKSILALFTVCTALNLPIIVFIDPISNWITTTFSNIDDTVNETENTASLSRGYIFFVLVSIINLPLLIHLLNGTNYMYEFIYFLLLILICILNPSEVVTTMYNLQYVLIGICVAFFCIKNIPDTTKEVLIILSMLGLNLLSENAINTLSNNPSIYIVLFLLIYLIGYIVLLSNTSIILLNNIKANGGRIISRIGSLPRIVFVELLCIFLFFYMRSISKRYYGGTLVVHEPITLLKASSFKINQLYNYEYTISCWMYMNATSAGHSQSSNEYTDVLLFGQELLMAYNSALNTLRIIMKNKNKKTIYDVKKLPLQKWNHFVVSYSNGMFDLFVNGELVKTSSIIPYSKTHELITGFENGVSGKLCNLLYFNNVITIEKINDLYTQFNDKNPPIF
jgi:hypothetical protein